jgi:hypothetical protein
MKDESKSLPEVGLKNPTCSKRMFEKYHYLSVRARHSVRDLLKRPRNSCRMPRPYRYGGTNRAFQTPSNTILGYICMTSIARTVA